MTIGEIICDKFRADELLMDSTNETNEQKFDKFVMMLSTMKVGFPAAYFFKQAGTTGELKTREAFLTEFPQKTRMTLPNLNPQFSFTDKEKSQIKVTQSAYHIVPALCLRHMKRAIKRKVEECRKRGETYLDNRRESILYKII